MDIKQQIRTLITEELLDDPNLPFDDETSLFRGKVLDSINLISLIDLLEQAFDIKISPRELSADSMDSIDNIAAFVSNKISK